MAVILEAVAYKYAYDVHLSEVKKAIKKKNKNIKVKEQDSCQSRPDQNTEKKLKVQILWKIFGKF